MTNEKETQLANFQESAVEYFVCPRVICRNVGAPRLGCSWTLCFCYRPQMKLREGNVFTSICLSTRRGWVHHMHHGMGHMVGYPHDFRPGYLPPPLLLTSGGQHWKPIPHPNQYLTSSGGRRNMYGWQMGGTEILSRFMLKFVPERAWRRLFLLSILYLHS